MPRSLVFAADVGWRWLLVGAVAYAALTVLVRLHDEWVIEEA